MPYDYDLFVIGGGSAGVRCARISATHGAKVAIAEERFWGGTCVNVGCVPKKIMVNAAEYGGWIADAPAFGWTVQSLGFDLGHLAAARDAEVARLNGIYGKLLQGAGCTIFEARATLVDPHTVQVGDRRVTAERIVIAVGGKPVRPEVPGAELGMVSDDVFDLKELPRRLVVVGSGYIGLEFACVFHGLGSEVDVVYRNELPLRGFDNDIRAALKEALAAQDIRQHAPRQLARLDRSAGGGVTVTLDDGSRIEADAALLATGRAPNLHGLGCDAVGVECTALGAIEVDEDHRTTVPSIFAIGDVTDKLNLTPMATAVGHALADTLFGRNPRQASYRNVPTAVFTSPPIGTVGMTEADAAACGPVDIYLTNLTPMATAVGHALADTLFGNNPRRASYRNVPTAVFTSPPIGTVGMTEADAAACGPVDIYTTRFTPMRHSVSRREGRKALMKLVVCQRTRCVLGAHMLGEDAPEIMQGIGIAVAMGATKEDFDRTIGIHPTAAEEFVTLRTRTREAGVRAAAE